MTYENKVKKKGMDGSRDEENLLKEMNKPENCNMELQQRTFIWQKSSLPAVRNKNSQKYSKLY
jgi:hypothetical protein